MPESSRDSKPPDTLASKDLATYVDAAAVLLGIPITPSWRPGVIAHLGVILANAELVIEAAGAIEAEPAPVYEVEA